MKGAYLFMQKTSICYYCMRYIKKMYGFNEEILLKDEFYKNFISSDREFLKTIDKNLAYTPKTLLTGQA